MEEIYHKIVALKDLTPSDEVNALFTRLVGEAVETRKPHSLKSDQVERLQVISSDAEYEMEKYWANEIIASADPHSKLQEFPYIQNYHELTKLEIQSLNGCTDHEEHRFLFIGGGPMPLTAIAMALDFGIKSVVIDTDREAVELSAKLVEKIGLADFIDIRHVSGEDFDYSDFNVIFVAALAGLQKEVKDKIFNQIKKTAKKGTHILARSSWNNREVLYKPLDDQIYSFKPIIKVDPYNDIVNSIVIMKYV